MEYSRPEPDVEGDRTPESVLAINLLLGNTCSKKRDSHLITYKFGKLALYPFITYKFGKLAMQIDLILFQLTMHKLVTDVKVIPGMEVALQHQLLVLDMRIVVPPKSKLKFIPRLKVGSLKTIMSNYLLEVFNSHVSESAGVVDAATEDIWNNIKTGLLKTTEVCGTTPA